MSNSKKILLTLFSLFLCYRSFSLMEALIASKPSEFSTFETLIISFLFTLFVTGIFAFIGFAYPSSYILPHRYYKIKNPKVLKRIYKVLGIKYFRILLLFAFWGRKNNRKKYFNGIIKGLKNFIFQTKQSEFGHFGAFIVILISSIILLVHGYIFLVIITTQINIVGNFYPIILQRSHRIRIEKMSL